MKAKDFVQTQLPGSYVWSPCWHTWVVKQNGVEIAPRSKKSIRDAWVLAKNKIQAFKKTFVDGKSAATGDSE